MRDFLYVVVGQTRISPDVYGLAKIKLSYSDNVTY